MMNIKFYIGILLLSVPLSMFGVNRYVITDDPDKKDSKLELFPVPVNEGVINVSSDNAIQKIEVLNIVGQLLLVEDIEPSLNIELEVSFLKSGIYLMKLTFTDNTQKVERFWVK